MRIFRKQHRLQINRAKGFTLIELLLYVAIVSSLLLAVTYFFATIADSRIKNQTITEVDQQGAYMMDYMTQTIRNATSITTPAAAGSGASLTLVVPTGALSPTIFNLSGSTLQVKEGAGAAVSLSSTSMTITSLTFKNLTRSGTNGIVQISFTLGRLNPDNKNEYDYVKTFTDSAEVRY